MLNYLKPNKEHRKQNQVLNNPHQLAARKPLAPRSISHEDRYK
ncbi:hypothetical protein RNAN_2932 [Rheinheimera nanhaiensis E407-8]|uniref:Uncharacterized protein n=1 Tax=Rheinheimera nanhaiensis E407-8 TaxID=562729 RepID=I1E0U1_9GAMM|nr:hypothetical protein RNAN_2932 [Rheinheimera nanhaiensis E407-8]